MRIIFSRNRAAQLDLLLRSLDANAPDPDIEATRIIVPAITEAYKCVFADHDMRYDFATEHDGFDACLRRQLDEAGDTVTFFCDDDVLYRPVPSLGADVLAADARVLTFSLRLGWPGAPSGAQIGADGVTMWRWSPLPPHDHGYPGSIDGHTFRTADVLRMLGDDRIENPLMLETILARRCSMLAEERPLMACYPEQALVGVPVNSVADQRGRPHGERFPQPAVELNARFLAGERIDLAALDFSGVGGCLHEIPFVWTAALTTEGSNR